ncbi:hypothetical protein WISP_05326 [Willisornis vidua]|uniref:Uncharacterized protein n=1 Tax=Willisornis vidua TaxID=1566151 RepID=A0ABQ9DXF6_9PASS|nr:hypothetical protein WISP_05326 [Willisornis vidua]
MDIEATSGKQQAICTASSAFFSSLTQGWGAKQHFCEITFKKEKNIIVLKKFGSEKRGVRIRERNIYEDTKVSGAGEGGGALGARVEIPLQRMGVQRSIHLNEACGRDQHRTRRMPKRHCDPTGSLCWSRVLEGTWGPMEREAHT